MSLVPVVSTTTPENCQIGGLHNLQELLSFSTSLTSNDSNATNTNLDEEKKQFLSNALAGVTVDLATEVNKLVKYIEFKNTDVHAEIEAYEFALKKLSNLVHMIDVANVFYKLGGREVISPLLTHAHLPLRAMAADLIAVCCQNNPYCQQLSMEDKFFGTLITLASDNSDAATQLKAISAISAIVRHNANGIAVLRKHNGFHMLQKALNVPNNKIIVKVLFFMNIISETDTTTRDDMFSLGIVDTLINLVKIPETPNNQENFMYNESAMVSEYALGNLVSFSNTKKEVINLCQQRNDGFTNYLQQMIKEKQSDDAFKEWVDAAEILYKRISDY